MLKFDHPFRLMVFTFFVILTGLLQAVYAQDDRNGNGGGGAVDLVLTKQADRIAARVGSRIIFTIKLKNTGLSPTDDVIVSDLLPSGFSFISSSNPQDYNPVTGEWEPDDLRAGDSISLQLVALVNPSTTATNYTNIAFIADKKNNDPQPLNDTAKVKIEVYDFTVTSSVICAQSAAALTASAVNVVNPVFRWYADQGLSQLLFTGANFATSKLETNQVFYVTVGGDNIPPDANPLVAAVSVLPSPVAPQLSLVQPTCSTASGTITVTAPLLAGFLYSVDGISFANASGVFSGLSAGTYNVYIKSPNGCVSASTQAVLNAQPLIPATPSLSVVQPTCSNGAGKITVSSPRNAGYRFSLDGVDFSDSTGVFSNLLPGTYNVSVRGTGGCISGITTAVIDQNPLVPAAPVVTVTQPACPSQTGSITITSPVGAGYTYSVDGNMYVNQTGIFNTLAPGTYAVSVKNADGCVSVATAATINLPVVNEPKLTITAAGSTQICSGGSVVLTAGEADSYQWYKYGIPLAGAQSRTYTALSEGVFTVSRRSNTGCLSQQSEGILVTVAAIPAQPVLYADKLTVCAGDSIRLQAVSNQPVQWLKDGNTIGGTSGYMLVVKEGGSYTVKTTDAGVCNGATSNAVFIQVLQQPEMPSLEIAQPDCFKAGIINVTAPLSPGNLYSIAGTGNFNASGVFSGLSTGTYNVYIKSPNGCVSASAQAVLNAQPLTPVTPSLSVVQPTCSNGGGKITVSSPRNAGYRFSLDGVDFSDSTGVFSNLLPGTYNVSVRGTSGCISGITTAVIEQNPLVPAAPVVTVTQPACPSQTGSITITSPVGAGYTYSVDGNMYVNQTGIFNTLAPGTYAVSVKNADGCVSVATAATINLPVVNEPKLTITAAGSTQICSGGSVVLTAGEADSYQWYKYGIPLAGAQSQTYTAISEGVFTVSRHSNTGCLSQQSEGILVTVAAIPAQPVLYAEKRSICAGDSAVLIAGAPAPLQWFRDDVLIDGRTDYTLVVKETGVYSVKSVSASGCAGLKSNPVLMQVLVRPNQPTVEVTQPDCFNRGIISIKSPLASGYLYSIDGVAYTNTSGLFTGMADGNYTVAVKASNGCVSPLTPVTIQSKPINDTLLTITAGSSTQLCAGGSVVLTASNAASYQWYQNGIPVAGAQMQTYTVSGEGVFTVSRKSEGSCVYPQSMGVPVRVVQSPPAPVIAAPKQLICAGETIVIQSSQAFALQWFRNGQPIAGANNVQLQVQASGTYAAQAANSAGCSSTFSNPVVITVIDLPVTPVLEIDGTMQFCKDETRLLKVKLVPPAHTIQWFRNNTLIPGIFSDTLRINDGAAYRVTLTNSNGCASIASNTVITAVVCVTGIYVPDVFTPNGDGINDVIKPITPGIKKFRWFRIYNRWGNLVFESADAQKGWDGKLRGKDQPAETYIWVVEGADSRGISIKKTGMLNLLR